MADNYITGGVSINLKPCVVTIEGDGKLNLSRRSYRMITLDSTGITNPMRKITVSGNVYKSAYADVCTESQEIAEQLPCFSVKVTFPKKETVDVFT